MRLIVFVQILLVYIFNPCRHGKGKPFRVGGGTRPDNIFFLHCALKIHQQGSKYQEYYWHVVEIHTDLTVTEGKFVVHNTGRFRILRTSPRFRCCASYNIHIRPLSWKKRRVWKGTIKKTTRVPNKRNGRKHFLKYQDALRLCDDELKASLSLSSSLSLRIIHENVWENTKT